jgi:hypothetical protein
MSNSEITARWRKALTSTAVDEATIREAFRHHLQRLGLPGRACVIHLSPAGALM